MRGFRVAFVREPPDSSRRQCSSPVSSVFCLLSLHTVTCPRVSGHIKGLAMLHVASVALATILVPASAPIAPLAPQSQGATMPSTLTVPKVYVFPMIGQMGTDISNHLLDILKQDIRKQKPDIIVYMLKSADVDRIEYLGPNDDAREFGLPMMEEYRDMAKGLKEELSDIPQVMWVEDSVGFATLMALAWPDLYMKSTARMWGLALVAQLAQHPDEDVAAKFLAARQGIGNGILQLGGYQTVLGDAMMLRERTLSVRFKGREVEWLPNTSGTWIVDGTDERTANFDATLAEDVLLSDGIADSLDDLMFLLGYREFTEIDSGVKLGKQYTEDWRKALERVGEWLEDSENIDEDGTTGLGKRRALFEKVLAAFKQYPAVEARYRMLGLTQIAVQIEIDNLRKEIQRLRDAERGSRGGRGGSGGGGGLGGAGGPGRR